jgi:hypothetical protein
MLDGMSGSAVAVVGTAGLTKTLKIKNKKQIKYGGNLLGGDFRLAEDNIFTCTTTPTRIDKKDKAYTIASSLEQQRKVFGDNTYYFSYDASTVHLKASSVVNQIISSNYDYTTINILSSSLASFSFNAAKARLSVTENDGSNIIYTMSSSLVAGVTNPATRANNIANAFETQRALSSNVTYYKFSAIGSRLAVVGTPVRSRKIKFDNNAVSSLGDILRGGFSILSGDNRTHLAIATSRIGTANYKLNNNFFIPESSSYITLSTVRLPKKAVVLTTAPIDTSITYKFVLDTTINERRVLLETPFKFS